MKRHTRQPGKNSNQQRLGTERIERLFELADRQFELHPEMSHRNVQLARKIAMRYKIRMPRRFKGLFCPKCYKYLRLKINCEARTRKGVRLIKCLECGNITKRPVKGRKQP